MENISSLRTAKDHAFKMVKACPTIQGILERNNRTGHGSTNNGSDSTYKQRAILCIEDTDELGVLVRIPISTYSAWSSLQGGHNFRETYSATVWFVYCQWATDGSIGAIYHVGKTLGQTGSASEVRNRLRVWKRIA